MSTSRSLTLRSRWLSTSRRSSLSAGVKSASTTPPLVPAPSRIFTVWATTPTYPAPEPDRASGCASANLARRDCTSASRVTPATPLMPPTPPRSAPVVSTRAGLPTARTLPLAITPPTSLTSTATAWSSCAKPGILRARPGALAAAGLYPAFHDRVHSGQLDPAEYRLDARVGEDGVEQAGELAVAVPDHE